ncbi:MAG: glycine cleavage system protein GcvH [Acidobacteriota bacterium]|nr:glycine cleavage system protein GcvH [Acidobacteriota bacterium]
MTPDDLYYSKEHEWLRLEGDGSATIGITDHAQQELGDIVYVELPDPGSALEADDVMGSVESVKAVSEIFSPVAGTVTAVNDALEDAPEVVNSDPYGDGWLIRLTLDDPGSVAATMLSAADYDKHVASEAD